MDLTAQLLYLEQDIVYSVMNFLLFNFQAFIKQRNYPAHVPVTKVPETGEPSEFKALFKQWDIMRTPAQMKAYSNNKIGWWTFRFSLRRGLVTIPKVFFTARQRSCGKVMFLVAFCSREPPVQDPGSTPPLCTGTLPPPFRAGPCSQTCSDLFNLDLSVQPVPRQTFKLFTMKHGLWEVVRLAFHYSGIKNVLAAKMSQQTKFDAASLHANPQTAAKARMPDDGSGTKKIWRVERKGNTYELAELDKKHYGYVLSIFCALTDNLMTIVYVEKQSYGPFMHVLKYPLSNFTGNYLVETVT